jgi:hypothetical protein
MFLGWSNQGGGDLETGSMCGNSEKFMENVKGRKRPLERPKDRWGNIKVDIKEMGCESVDWI